MSRLLRRASLRDLARRPAHFLLAVAGVALGVAVVLGIELSIGSARSAFDFSAQAISGEVTHQVIAGARGIASELVSELETQVGGQGEVRSIVEGRGLLNQSAPLRLFGVDLIGRGATSSESPQVASGGTMAIEVFGHEATVEILPLARLNLAVPGLDGLPVALTADRAARLGIELGDRLELVTVQGTFSGRLAARVDFSQALYARAFDDALFLEKSAATRVLGLEGVATRLDLLLESDDESLAAVRALLPDGARLVDAGELRESTLRLTRAFEVNLSALALLALLCGAFLVYGTINLSVVERRAQIGLWRSLGASRRTVLRRILGDVLLLGVLGSVIGVALGLVMAQGLVRLVTQTVTDLYFASSVRRVDVELLSILRALLVGTVVSLLAGLRPALEAMGQPPRLSLVGQSSGTGFSWRALVGGVVLMGLSSAGIAFSGDGLVLTFGALFAGVVGFVLMVPSLSSALALGIWRVAPRRLTILRLALRSHRQSLERTAVALSALCLAIGSTLGIGVMVGSFRDAVQVWLGSTLQQDLYLSSGIGSRRTPWDKEALDDIAGLPGVVQLQTVKRSVVVDGNDVQGSTLIVAIETSREGFRGYQLLGRNIEVERIWSAFEGGRGVLISEPMAYRRSLDTGEALALETDRGRRTFEVLGVYRDYSSDRGEVLMARDTWESYYDDHSIDGAALALSPGSDVEGMRDRVAALLDPSLGLEVRSAKGLREASLAIFDRTFLITGVLRLLAGTIAFLGVLSALLAVLLDRRREHAVLRSLGVSGRQLRSLLLIETAFMGAVAGALSIPLGVVLGWLLVNVVSRRSFGWSMELQVPPSQLVMAIALAVLAATLAGIGPARRLLRTPPALALRSD